VSEQEFTIRKKVEAIAINLNINIFGVETPDLLDSISMRLHEDAQAQWCNDNLEDDEEEE